MALDDPRIEMFTESHMRACPEIVKHAKAFPLNKRPRSSRDAMMVVVTETVMNEQRPTQNGTLISLFKSGMQRHHHSPPRSILLCVWAGDAQQAISAGPSFALFYAPFARFSFPWPSGRPLP